jgi:hypothetical protein
LQVRLWSGAGRPDDDVPAGALAMVQDFLGVSPCEPFELGRTAVCGVFSDPVQAVNAGRRLQRMMQGYGRAVSGGLGAGLLLTGSDETLTDTEMDELRQKQALSLAPPGQLFVVGALCDKVRSIPGLQFKAIDAALGNGADGKPRRVMLVVPVAGEARNSADDGMRTRLVESLATSRSQEIAIDARRTMPLVLAPVAAKAVGAPVVANEAASANEVEPASALWARPPVRWAIGGAAAVLVLAAVAMGVHGRSPTKDSPAAGVAVTPAPAAAATAANASAPAVSDSGKARKKPNEGRTVVPPATVAAAPASAGKPDAEPKPEGAKHEPIAPPPPPTETKPRERPSSGGVSVSYSAEEISSLLAHADKQSGDGNYDQAIREYKSVLSHDPGNARAKQGLARAMHNNGGG